MGPCVLCRPTAVLDVPCGVDGAAVRLYGVCTCVCCASRSVDSVTAAVRSLAQWEPDMDAQLVQLATALTSPRRREEMAAVQRRAAEQRTGSTGAGAGAGASAASVSDPAPSPSPSPRPYAAAVSGTDVATARFASSPLDLQPADVVLTPDDALVFQRLSDVPLEALRLRFAVLRLFNLKLVRVVPLLDLVNAGDVYSMGYKLRMLGHCIFVDTKSRVLEVGRRAVGGFMVLVVPWRRRHQTHTARL